MKVPYSRRKTRPVLSGAGIESLEPRQLLSVGTSDIGDTTAPSLGVSIISNQVRDLGSVTPAAAVAGVQATANIPAGDAVTFRFAVELEGTYRLFVSHNGGDLTLFAQTPGGDETIHPGPAGPFDQLILDLVPGDYLITASASGSASVFVDWELILYNGVGQSPALSVDLGSNATAPSAVSFSALNAVSTFSPAVVSTNTTISSSASAAGLTLTLEITPAGNPTAPGQSVSIRADVLPWVPDSLTDSAPALAAVLEPGARELWQATQVAIENPRVVPRPHSEAGNVSDLDEQSLLAVAWVDGLIAKLPHVAGIHDQTIVPRAVAPVIAQVVEPRSDVSAQPDEIPKTADPTNLGPMLAIGVAVVAANYGRKISIRRRPATRLARHVFHRFETRNHCRPAIPVMPDRQPQVLHLSPSALPIMLAWAPHDQSSAGDYSDLVGDIHKG